MRLALEFCRENLDLSENLSNRVRKQPQIIFENKLEFSCDLPGQIHETLFFLNYILSPYRPSSQASLGIIFHGPST